MERIAAGVYQDANNALHLDIPELLRANGYADTPQARELVAKAAQQVAGQVWPGLPVTVLD